MVDNPGDYALKDIMSKMTIEERIYRFRCVEAWSMGCALGNGFELKDLLDLAGVQSGAKYVAFETLYPSRRNAGPAPAIPRLALCRGSAVWNEANHPLTLMATGIYGKPMPKSERRADPSGCALEVWLQIHQIHRAHHADGQRAAHQLEQVDPKRIRFLFPT